jgi:hypothetical protein
MRRGLAVFAVVLVLASPTARPAGPPARQPGHWAFRPPVRRQLPAASYPAWTRNAVDAFILARLDGAKMRPAPAADRVTLIRRLTFDLIGLPPTPAEVDAFIADKRPDAYKRLVDRLLASPRYGERWGQHWLDVARYADSDGFEADRERPYAWRFRDWVVRALNADQPYDRFVAAQVAGDLLARSASGAARADLLTAAGFNRLGTVHPAGGNLDPAVSRQEVLTEMTTGVGAAFLGMTVACARCHDHKFDPFPQKDYYQLEAFFSATEFADIGLATAGERLAYTARLAAHQARVAPLTARLTALDAPYRKRLHETKMAALEPHYRAALAIDPKKRTPEQAKLAKHAEVLLEITWDEVVALLTPPDRVLRARLRERLHAEQARRPLPPTAAWTLNEKPTALASHILRRGDAHRKIRRVVPDYPDALRSGSPGPSPTDRRALARWLTRPDHPLTARVIANRLWQHHFGKGLVRTPNDFGLRGDRPTHPELLDWLARDLVEHGWSLKQLHRRMVTSATYRMASRPADPRTRKSDPDNRLVSHQNRHRLEGEIMRDAALAVSGTLTPWVGGPPVRVPLEPEVYEQIFTEHEPDGLWLVTPDRRQHTRRSLYLLVKRNVRLPQLESFDQPDAISSCPVRPVSTFAPQALILMNGPFLQEQSRALASRLLRKGGRTAAGQVEHAYRLALGRPPRAEERKVAVEFLATQADLLRDRLLSRRTVALPADLPRGADPAHAAALADFCLALLNRNAFVHVD